LDILDPDLTDEQKAEILREKDEDQERYAKGVIVDYNNNLVSGNGKLKNKNNNQF